MKNEKFEVPATGNDIEDYNNIPVYYCQDCHSLAIIAFCNTSYCKDCSSTNINKSSFEDWEKLTIK